MKISCVYRGPASLRGFIRGLDPFYSIGKFRKFPFYRLRKLRKLLFIGTQKTKVLFPFTVVYTVVYSPTIAAALSPKILASLR